MSRSAWDSGGAHHWRTYSMGSWMRDRDEDLALFHDMRKRERNNFLHPSNDDIEASLSTKFGGLSGYRFSVSTPTRIDLLTSDTEKNDYDWLLTPPGTPLFPSLDQDAPIISLSHRGALSQSASGPKVSRLSQGYEPSPKVLRRNPSPRRPSTASSTSSTNSTARGKASSSSLRSSSPVLRASTRSGRSPTPPGASTRVGRSTTRSSTPTLRRTNTTPSIRSSSAGKIASSTGRTRGNSLSPKLQAWQPSFPGFSSEPPPNLRTSLSDRSSSSSRGASLGSRPGGTCGPRNLEACENSRARRQHASPSISRSSSSPNSRDQSSVQTSKGSAISLYDDDMESIQSSGSGSKRASSDSMVGPSKVAPRLEGQFGGKYSVPAKRQIRSTFISGDRSAFGGVTAKKNVEPSMRQVDHRRSSQGMFRPLLSSVPASSFYSTRSGGIQRRSASPARESSFTISSNASSEQGVRIVPNNGSSSDEDEGVKKGNRQKSLSPEVPEQELGLANLEGYPESTTGPEDLHPCRSADRCETNEVEITMSVDWSQKEASDDWIRDGSRTKCDSQRITQLKQNQVFTYNIDQGHARDDLTNLDSQRRRAFSPCIEENTDSLFVDIQVDLSVPSHTYKTHESGHGELYIDSSPEPPASEPMELNSILDQEALDQGVVIGQQSKKWFSEEQHGFGGFKESKYDLNMDVQQLSSQTGDHLREVVAQEHSKNLYTNDKQILSSSYVTHRSKEYDSYVQENAFDSRTKSQHFSTVFIESLHGNNLADIPKPESTAFCLNHVVERRMDCPVTDGLPFGRSNSARKDLNLNLHDGTASTERIFSCEVLASKLLFPCQNLGDQGKRVHAEEWGRNLSIISDCPLKRGNEIAPPVILNGAGLFGHQTEIPSEECCREYSVDVIEGPVSSEARILDNTGTNINPAKVSSIEKHAFCAERVMPLERKESSEGTIDTDLVEKMELESYKELQDTSISVAIRSILLDAVDQSCSFTGNPTVDGLSIVSLRGTPEYLAQDLVPGAVRCEMEGTKGALDDSTVLVGSGEILPVMDSLVEKISETEIGLVISDPSVLSIGYSDSLQGEPKHSCALAADVMDQSECANSIKSISELLDQDTTLSGTPPVSRNIILDEGTETTLFCRSIVHDIVYKAAALAMEKEARASLATPSPTGELVTLFGFSEAGQRNLFGVEVHKSGHWKGKPMGGDSAVRRTLTYVQNQKVILRQTPRQTPSVTIQQNPMEGTESAIMKTHEALTHKVTKVRKDKMKTNKVKSRCRCTVM